MVVHVDIIESFRSDNEYKYDRRFSLRAQCACVESVTSHTRLHTRGRHLVVRRDRPEKSYS